MKLMIATLTFFACLVRTGPVFANDASHVLQLVYKAQELLKNETPKLIYSTRGRNKKVIGRDVPIALYDSESDSILLIRLTISLERTECINKKCEKTVDVLNTDPPGYAVAKLGGNGINTLFKVIKAGKEYFFFGWHYIKHNAPETLVYSPYTDFLARQEVIAEGREYLETKILEARLELKKLGVRSRAIPQLLVADLIPERLLLNLALIEHMDEEEYEGRGGLYMGNKVFVQLALNRENVWSYAKSHAGALCLMQIMPTTYRGFCGRHNKKGRCLKYHPGVQQLYPAAKLPSDPMVGSCGDHISALKTAYLVLDDKLTYMPANFKERFRLEPLRFGFVLAAAYNGGHKKAIALYEKVNKSRLYELLDDLWSFFTTRKHEFLEYRILQEETWIFVKKYIDIDTMF